MPTPSKPRRPPSDDGLLIIGLIGRAGSGKSTVADVLTSRGARVLDADRIGHDVTDRDPDVRAALLADYGPAAYREDGTLDRALVAAAVFANRDALAALNRLVHPRILQQLRAQLAHLVAQGYHGPVVVDAALLLDWAFERECDAVIAVIAPEEAQVSRLAETRGWSAHDVRARLAAQRPDAELAAAADEVLDNRGSLAELARAASDALDRLLAAHARQPR
jgi:dephospho-CoA kinase